MNGDAMQRRQDMLADKTAAFREAFDVAFDHEFRIGKIAAAARGVGGQRADAAVDIDRIVAPVGAGITRQLVKRFLALAEPGGQRAQPVGALVKRQLAQARSADLARMPDHSREIQPRARRARDDMAIHRAGDIDEAA